MSKKPVSEQVRELVESAEMTRYRLSQLSGVDQSALSRFVRGQQKLTMDSLDDIGSVLGFVVLPKAKAATPTPTPKPKSKAKPKSKPKGKKR